MGPPIVLLSRFCPGHHPAPATTSGLNPARAPADGKATDWRDGFSSLVHAPKTALTFRPSQLNHILTSRPARTSPKVP
jgi:hypothetical protein